MSEIDLKSLGIEKRWPKLAKQDDLAKFQTQHQKAVAEVEKLRAQLPDARNADLNAEAQALREEKKRPEATHEPAVQRNLEHAGRERDVLARTIESVQTELGEFLVKHRGELFTEVSEARHKIALEVARNSQAALSGYARYEDLRYVLRSLQPPAPERQVAGTGAHVIGYFGTPQAAGPQRGDIETALHYLASLPSVDAKKADDAT